MIATTRTSAKKQALLDHGADAVVATQEEDLVEHVQAITGGQGAHVVFDPIGGPMMEPLAAAVAPLGHVLIYGLLEPAPMTLPSLPLMLKCFSVQGYQVFNFTGSPAFPRQEVAFERAKAFLYEHVENGSLVPVTDPKEFELAHIQDAHRYMESNEQIGKIIVTVRG